jgi:hypothetical protein
MSASWQLGDREDGVVIMPKPVALDATNGVQPALRGCSPPGTSLLNWELFPGSGACAGAVHLLGGCGIPNQPLPVRRLMVINRSEPRSGDRYQRADTGDESAGGDERRRHVRGLGGRQKREAADDLSSRLGLGQEGVNSRSDVARRAPVHPDHANRPGDAGGDAAHEHQTDAADDQVGRESQNDQAGRTCQAAKRVGAAGSASPFDPYLHQAERDGTGRR